MKLTKSLFIQYLDSPLHMWLSFRGEVQPLPLSEYDQHVVEQGYQVEALAKEFLRQKVASEYPQGTTLTFESVLTDGNYESRIDALVHDTVHDTYDLYEIKSSTGVHSSHKYDVTFQYLIAKNTLPVNKVYLVHVNGEYKRQGEIDITQLFTVEDMHYYIQRKIDEVYQERIEAWNVLNLPTMPVDEHCFKPKTCPFPSICFPELPKYSIYDLSRATQKQLSELEDMQIKLLRDIPDGFTPNYKQKLQIQTTRIEQPIINHQAITHELERLQFPLYFLDYETFGPALPMYDGYSPYQMITNQFSIHVVRHPDDPEDKYEHYEFLATEPTDPSAEIAAKLCEVIGDTGTIIVWNKGFECGRNTELGILCTEFCDKLQSINNRTYDLMEIFSNGFYVDHRFLGSASIKKVLPILCPELSYKVLEIGDGVTAMTKWYDMVHGNLSEEERAKIQQDLLTYCKLDTWAMVAIWKKVREVVG